MGHNIFFPVLIISDKTYKPLATKNKKILYSGLIHSHLVYGLLIWGFAKAGKLQTLVVKQKNAIMKLFHLMFRDHTHTSFMKDSILKLHNLIKHTTLCYLYSGLTETSPSHVKQLWNYSMVTREASRQTFPDIKPIISPRQWINDLPPNRQARLWNTSKMDRTLKPSAFKAKNKLAILAN